MGRPLESPLPMEELLAHAGWLRALAASLVADPARADDLVQDTWLAALKRPPLAGASPRPWLERVFRNLARNRRRDERTRAEHETRATVGAPGPSADAIAQEVEAQRVLAEAVGRLSEPARTIVVLRYFRGLDSRAIGRELALPAGTVRWKLKAALEELRRELDRRFEGGRRAWSLVLARLLGATAPPSLAIPWLALCGAAAVAVVACWWRLGRAGALEVELAATTGEGIALESPVAELFPPADAPDAESELQTAISRQPLHGLAAPARRREPVPDIAGSVLVDGAPPKEPVDLELTVLGSLIPGLPPPTHGYTRRLATDEGGSFAIFAAGTGTLCTLRAPGFLLEDEASEVWRPLSLVTPSLELVVRLRTPPAIRGRAVTPDGRGVPGAHVVYYLRATATDWQILPGPDELYCDGDGRFELALLDLMAEGNPKLRENHACEGTLLIEVPRVGRRLLETGPFPPGDLDLGDVVLEAVRALRFVVRDEHGSPLSGAVARLDDYWLSRPSSPTNGEGRGELRHAPYRNVRVRFSALGYGDRVQEIEVGEEPCVWLEPRTLLEVQLEPPAGSDGPFPAVVLTARDPLFDPLDAPSWGLAFDIDPIQTELGASANAGRQIWSDAEGEHHRARFEPDRGGKAVIAGIRPDVPFTLEALDDAGHLLQGRVLARRELSMSAGERKRIALPYDE